MIDEAFMIREHARYAVQMARACGKRMMINVVQDLDMKDRRLADKVRKELRKSTQPKWAQTTEIPIHPAIRPIRGNNGR